MAKNGLARAFFLALWSVVGTSFKYELNDMVEQAHTRYARFSVVLCSRFSLSSVRQTPSSSCF